MPQREYPATPLLAVAGIVLNEQSEILLVRRKNNPGKGQWSIPGGLVETGERLVSAVRREIFEETGIHAEPQAIVEVVERIYSDSELQDSRTQYHYVIVDYWCKATGGVMHPATDASEVCWAPRQQLAADTIALDSVAIQAVDKALKSAQAAKRHA